MGAEESDGCSKEDDCESAAVVGRDEVACVENEASLRGIDMGIGRSKARRDTTRPAWIVAAALHRRLAVEEDATAENR